MQVQDVDHIDPTGLTHYRKMTRKNCSKQCKYTAKRNDKILHHYQKVLQINTYLQKHYS